MHTRSEVCATRVCVLTVLVSLPDGWSLLVLFCLLYVLYLWIFVYVCIDFVNLFVHSGALVTYGGCCVVYTCVCTPTSEKKKGQIKK